MLASLAHDGGAYAWLVVVAYLLGAAFAALAARGAKRKRERLFWYAMAFLLLILGANKQLDLQTLVTTVGRDLAKSEGWYQYRRIAQVVFVGLLAVGAIAFLAAILAWARKAPRSVKVAAAGSVLLSAFIVTRAASFHHIDEWVTVSIDGLRSGWWLELAGIAAIGFSGLAYRAGH